MTTDQLTQWLLSDDPAPLAKEDRAVLARAVAELAVAQALIAKQSILLQSFDSDHAALETALRAPFNSLTQSLQSSDPQPFDYTVAEQARHELAGKLAQATTLRAALALALNAVQAVMRN